jgi:putative transposase
MNKEIRLVPGSPVVVDGQDFVITHLLDLETAVVVSPDQGERRIVAVSAIEPPSANAVDSYTDIHSVSDADWSAAKARYDIIEPLLRMPRRKRSDVEAAAHKHQINATTIYRWITKFSQTSALISLVPDKPSGGRDKPRLTKSVEEVIEHYVRNEYLTAQKIKDGELCARVRTACIRAGLPPPHSNTIRKRLKKIPGRIRASGRGHRRLAETFQPTPGSFPDVRLPLQVYQIDHTWMDVEIVDDVHRAPIGRPWITVAVDVWSRTVSGFVISLDAPSALSVGLVIAHALLPKEAWLAERNIDFSWPIWGKPASIHADNGADFRCAAVTRGCQNHGIDVQWRPVAKPRYGAHIERLLGTVSTELKTLPGATFSNIKERGEYKSSERACMTLRELECWVATFILGKYHHRLHSAIKMPPLKRFEEGIHGTVSTPGRGLPPRPSNGRRLLIDFLPSEMRTVQPYGVMLDGVTYYADGIRHWVNAESAGDESSKMKFRVHRDPRSISPVFFFDPTLDDYIELPYANLAHPQISLWELRAAKRRLIEAGKAATDENAIFRAVEVMRKIQEAASDRTKSARRETQKRKTRAQSLQAFPTESPKPKAPPQQDSPPSIIPPLPYQSIAPFDEIEGLNG